MNFWDYGTIATFFAVFAIVGSRYAVFSCFSYFVIMKKLKDKLTRFRIPNKPVNKEIMPREVFYSITTIITFSLTSTVLFYLSGEGINKLYTDVNQYDRIQIFWGVLFLIFYYDFVFYVLHRIYHTKWMFRTFHKYHHMTSNPSPFAALSFHPIEALTSSGSLIVASFIFPIHPYALGIFFTWMGIINAIAHMPYEFYPKIIVKWNLTKVFNTAVHHNMHHQYNHCNYSLFFNYMDYFFGTNHEKYESKLKSVMIDQREASKSTEVGVGFADNA